MESLEQRVLLASLDGRGANYGQDFDLALGVEGAAAGSRLPEGWSVAIGGETLTSITQAFPASDVVDGAYNAGREGSLDRALATGATGTDRQHELQFLAEVTGGDASAARLTFDIEAWDADEMLAANPGEAAYDVVLEADTGSGFQTVADFGRVTTGATLHPPLPPLGRELWKTDGTNVLLVADMVQGEQGSSPRGFVEFHDELYFEIGKGFSATLVKYDGSSVSTLAEDLFVRARTVFNDALYVFNLHGSVLKIDDSGISTIEPRERDYFQHSGTFEFNGELYFAAFLDDRIKEELWKFDGTEISLVADLNERTDDCESSNPQEFTVFDNELYFTAAGTYVGPCGGGNTHTAFRASRELWKLDGSVPIKVADIVPGRRTSDPIELTIYNDELYFYANDIATGYELWKFDGITASQVADIRPGPKGAFGNLNENIQFDQYGGQFTEFDNELYFVANDGVTGWEMWKTDGMSVSRVTDINPGGGDSVPTGRSSGWPSPRNIIVYNDELYFIAEDGTNVGGVWKTDGENVSLVADLNPTGDYMASTISVDARLWQFFIFDDELYFLADDGASGRELWKTDGNDTTQVTDINVGPGDSLLSVYIEPFEFNGELYFDADNGSRGSDFIDGNAPANRIHFDSGVIDVRIPVGATLRLRFNAQNVGATVGYVFGLDNIDFYLLAAGDSDGNGQFDQTDIVRVLQTAKYLTGKPATFEDGDWNRDDVFDQLDIVAAFQTDNYLS